MKIMNKITHKISPLGPKLNMLVLLVLYSWIILLSDDEYLIIAKKILVDDIKYISQRKHNKLLVKNAIIFGILHFIYFISNIKIKKNTVEDIIKRSAMINPGIKSYEIAALSIEGICIMFQKT